MTFDPCLGGPGVYLAFGKIINVYRQKCLLVRFFASTTCGTNLSWNWTIPSMDISWSVFVQCDTVTHSDHHFKWKFTAILFWELVIVAAVANTFKLKFKNFRLWFLYIIWSQPPAPKYHRTNWRTKNWHVGVRNLGKHPVFQNSKGKNSVCKLT